MSGVEQVCFRRSPPRPPGPAAAAAGRAPVAVLRDVSNAQNGNKVRALCVRAHALCSVLSPFCVEFKPNEFAPQCEKCTIIINLVCPLQ